MKGTCPVCGRVVGARVPRGGDGSGIMLRSHTRPDNGAPCLGNRLVDRGLEFVAPDESRPRGED